VVNFPFFVSRRITAEGQGSFSSMISKIAVASVAIGLATVLISFMILWGYKQKIEEKIFSFAGHLQVTKYTLGSSFEEQPISTQSNFYQHYDSVSFIDHVQSFAYKAGLLKTSDEVQGIVIKGIGQNFDTTRFSQNLVAGSFINLPDSGYTTDLILSRKLSSMLQLNVGDDALVYFVQNPPRYRQVKVAVIYETGLEDFDEKFVLGDLRLVQRINNWPDSLIGGL
jgi:lipoprotein-releasing system permease protein